MKNKLIHVTGCLSVCLLVLAGLSAFSAAAQEKKAASAPKVVTKVLFENDKVRAQELHYAPGAENSNVSREGRVVRALTAGALQRTYPDGKKENIEYKAGEVRFNAAITGATPQYTVKNVGKNELVLYVVVLK